IWGLAGSDYHGRVFAEVEVTTLWCNLVVGNKPLKLYLLKYLYININLLFLCMASMKHIQSYIHNIGYVMNRHNR
uniref:Uncharacterized protein n=1 Tax=Ciona intestinalis TaxID=7719 RepID=H2XY57_CIOIN